MARQFGGDMTANRPQDLIAALMFKREVWGGQGGGGQRWGEACVVSTISTKAKVGHKSQDDKK